MTSLATQLETWEERYEEARVERDHAKARLIEAERKVEWMAQLVKGLDTAQKAEYMLNRDEGDSDG